MNRKITKKLEMAAGVVEFQKSNPLSDRSQSAIAAQFAKKLAEAETLARAERREQQAARAATRQAQELRRGLATHLLPSLARIGAFALRGDAQAMSRFVAPTVNQSRALFITQATSLVDAAREHQDALFRHGFTKTQLGEVAARLQQFQSATTEAKNAQQRQREFGAKLSRAMAELSELLRLLDAFHRVRLERDPELLQVWTTLRTVGNVAATRSKRVAPANATPPSTPPAAAPATQQATQTTISPTPPPTTAPTTSPDTDATPPAPSAAA